MVWAITREKKKHVMWVAVYQRIALIHSPALMLAHRETPQQEENWGIEEKTSGNRSKADTSEAVAVTLEGIRWAWTVTIDQWSRIVYMGRDEIEGWLGMILCSWLCGLVKWMHPNRKIFPWMSLHSGRSWGEREKGKRKTTPRKMRMSLCLRTALTSCNNRVYSVHVAMLLSVVLPVYVPY